MLGNPRKPLEPPGNPPGNPFKYERKPFMYVQADPFGWSWASARRTFLVSWYTPLGLACACLFHSFCKRAVFVSNFLSRAAFFECTRLSWAAAWKTTLVVLVCPSRPLFAHVDFIVFVDVPFLFPTFCPGLPVSVQDEMFGIKSLQAAGVRLNGLHVQ